MRFRRGIGLIGLFLIIAIIAVLAGLMLPASNATRSYSKTNKNYEERSNAKAIESSSLVDASVSPNASVIVADRMSRGDTVDQVLERATDNRRIIYVADMSVVVNDVDEAEQKMLSLVKELDGYIAEATVNRSQGQPLSGRWKIRIPDAKFDVFLEEISTLGVVESRNQSTQDVTEEYVDLEAQAANKKALEDRIKALLEKSTDKITDVITVERELGRIRGEIERLEGRLRYLANQTSMTTISLALREEQEYEPELPPTFLNEMGEAWNDSLESLKNFTKRFLLATVMASPWIVMASVILVPGYWFVKKRMQK